MFPGLLCQFPSLFLWFFPMIQGLFLRGLMWARPPCCVRKKSVCWLGERILLTAQQLWKTHLHLPVKSESRALQWNLSVGFLPLAIKLHSHRITRPEFLTPFGSSQTVLGVDLKQSWAGSKLWSFQLCSCSSAAPRTHKKGEDEKNNQSPVITSSVPITMLNALKAASHWILTISHAC